MDDLVSPRAGIVYKPIVPLSVYGSYTVSYLPSSGDQFSSLTAITEQVKPEKFGNYEVGAKWEPRRDLGLTVALDRLDRTYTRVDLAAFYTLRHDLRLQANLENALDTRYWINADSNTNLSPGFGRSLRVALTTAF